MEKNNGLCRVPVIWTYPLSATLVYLKLTYQTWDSGNICRVFKLNFQLRFVFSSFSLYLYQIWIITWKASPFLLLEAILYLPLLCMGFKLILLTIWAIRIFFLSIKGTWSSNEPTQCLVLVLPVRGVLFYPIW